MPDVTVKNIDELERYTGSFQKGQQFFFAGKSLGLSRLGMNAVRPALSKRRAALWMLSGPARLSLEVRRNNEKGRNMKSIYAAALMAAVVTAAGCAGPSGKQAAARKVYLLKSGGETLAELVPRPSATVAIEGANPSSHSEYYPGTGTTVAKGGAVLKLTAGTNSISAQAEEIESAPAPK